MKSISYTNTLVYYDGVQVFAGQDSDGARYFGVMVDSTGETDRYLVVAVAPNPLRRFYSGELDLRTLLLDCSTESWYTALVADDFEKPVSLEQEQGSLLATDYLPGPGFRLRGAPVDELMSTAPEGKDGQPDTAKQSHGQTFPGRALMTNP